MEELARSHIRCARRGHVSVPRRREWYRKEQPAGTLICRRVSRGAIAGSSNIQGESTGRDAFSSSRCKAHGCAGTILFTRTLERSCEQRTQLGWHNPLGKSAKRDRRARNSEL